MKLGNKILLAGALSGATFLGAAGGSMFNLAANAATNTAATTATADTAATTVDTANPTAAPQYNPSQGGHTANGITETLLTGDSATKAKAAAEAAEPGATIERAETDAEGAKYEVHMTKSDGSQVTVKLDENYKVTSTESR